MIANNTLLVPRIESRIQVIRGLRVMLDVDLAALYGVQTKRLNEQVKRNRDRFPSDFLFQLAADEKTEVVANCDHLQNLKFSKALPFAFAEHGAIQAASFTSICKYLTQHLTSQRAHLQIWLDARTSPLLGRILFGRQLLQGNQELPTYSRTGGTRWPIWSYAVILFTQTSSSVDNISRDQHSTIRLTQQRKVQPHIFSG